MADEASVSTCAPSSDVMGASQDSPVESVEITRLVIELSTVTRRAFRRMKRPVTSQAKLTLPTTPAPKSFETPRTGSPVVLAKTDCRAKLTRHVNSIDSPSVTVPAFGSPIVRQTRDWIPCTPALPSFHGTQKRFTAVRKKGVVRASGYGTVLRSREMREEGDLFAEDKSVPACVARRIVEHGVGRPENEMSPLSFLLGLPGWNLVCERMQCPFDDRETIFDQLECAPTDILELLERNFVSVGCKNIPASIKPSLVLEECIRAEACKRVDDLETVERRKERLKQHQTDYDTQRTSPSKENSRKVAKTTDNADKSRITLTEIREGANQKSTSSGKRGSIPIVSRRKRVKRAFDSKRELLTDLQSISEHLLTDREFALASLRAAVRQYFLEQKLESTSVIREWLDLISLTNDAECISILRRALEQERIPRVRGICCPLVLAFQRNTEALQYYDRELPNWPFSSKDAPAIAVALLENHLPLPKCVTAKLPRDARVKLSAKTRMWLACWQADMKVPEWQDLDILSSLLDTAGQAELREPFLPNPLVARLCNIETVSDDVARKIVEVANARKIQPDIKAMLSLAVRSNPTLLLDACLAASSLELVESVPLEVLAALERPVERPAFERLLALFKELKETRPCHWDFLHAVCAHVFPPIEDMTEPTCKDDSCPKWIRLLHQCPSSYLLLNVVLSLENIPDRDLSMIPSKMRPVLAEILTEITQLLGVDEMFEDNYEKVVQKAGFLETNVMAKTKALDSCRRKLHGILERGYRITEDSADASANFYYELIQILKIDERS